MSRIAPTQIKAEPSSIPLETLSPFGRRHFDQAAIDNDILRIQNPADQFGSRTSLTETYDPEILIAREERFTLAIAVSKAALQTAIRDILANRTARNSLKVTLVFGSIGIIYWAISLIPAFEGAIDSRQNIAYAFLQECANRKVGILEASCL